MGRGFKLVFFVIIIVISLGIGGVTWLQKKIPPEHLAAMLAEQIKTSTGRDFEIRGPVSLSFFPTLAVVAEDVHLANSAWATRSDMVFVRKVSIEIGLRPLLNDVLDVRHVIVEEGQIAFEKSSRGDSNWVFQSKKSAPSKTQVEKSKYEVRFGSIMLRNVTLSLSEAGVQTQQVKLVALKGSPSGDRYRLEGQVDWMAQQWGISGDLENLRSDSTDFERRSFGMQLKTNGLTADLKGWLGYGRQDGDAAADIKLALNDPALLQRSFPQLVGLKLPANIAASVQKAGEQWAVPSFKVTLGVQSLSGDLVIDQQPRLKVAARLVAATLDLRGVFASAVAKQPPIIQSGKSAPLFSRTPLPLPTAISVPFDLELAVDNFSAENIPPIQNLKLRAKANGERVEVEQFSGNLSRGSFSASGLLVLHEKKLPNFKLKLDANDLSAEVLVSIFGVQPSALGGGKVRVVADLAAQGDSLHALAGSVDGEALVHGVDMALNAGGKALGGNILVRLFRTVMPGETLNQGSLVSCAVIRLPLKKGVADIDQLIALESKEFDAVAVGKIDFGAETVSLAFRPTVNRGLGVSIANFSGLMRLEGSMQNPSFGIDPTGALLKAADVSAMIATSGISSLAQRYLRKETTQISPCQNALSYTAKRNSTKKAKRRR